MPIVQVEIAEGRTIAQKRELVSKMTEAFTSSLRVSPENVQIIIKEFKPENYAKSGKLKIDR